SVGYIMGRDRNNADPRIRAALAGRIATADVALRTDSHLAALAAIRAGVGIGICQVALAARRPDLGRGLDAGFDVGFQTWVVMHEDLRRVRRLRVTFDHLVAALTAHCAGN